MTFERMIAQLTASLIIIGTRVKAALHHVLVLVEGDGVRTRGNRPKKANGNRRSSRGALEIGNLKLSTAPIQILYTE